MSEQEKGTWEKRYRYANLWSFRCSFCKKTCPQSQCEVAQYAFCPHCGKPMQVGSEVKNEQV